MNQSYVENPPFEYMDSSSKNQVKSWKHFGSDFRDRIETARSPGIGLNIEKRSWDVEKDEILKRNSSTQISLTTPNVWTVGAGAGAEAEAEADRIECTRNKRDQSILTRCDKSETVLLTKGHGNSSMAANAIGCNQRHYQGTPSQSYKVQSPQISSRIDPKTTRFLHRNEFESLRSEYSEYLRELVSQNDIPKSSFRGTKNQVRFVVRNRPLRDHEVKGGELSVIEVPWGSSTTMALYEANVLADRDILDCKIHLFRFDTVVSETASAEEFYNQSVRSSVADAIDGGLGTIIVFGPDECGKSRTISDIEYRASLDLFSDPVVSTRSVSVKCMGIGFGGDHFVDLIGPIHNQVETVKLGEDYQIEGALQINVSSARDFLDTLCLARQRLASASRRMLQQQGEAASYLLCEIRIRNQSGKLGSLYLLQCPRGDEVQSTKKKRNPFANLMETLRTKPSTSNLAPTCVLTRLLGPCILSSGKSKVCLVAGVSPSSLDTEATLSTLISSREYMRGIEHNYVGWSNVELGKTDTEDEKDLMLPRQWSRKQLMDWIARKNLLDRKVEGEFTGSNVMKMGTKELKEFFFNSAVNGEEKASRLFNALRAENDRVARLRVKRKFALQKTKNDV